MLLTGERPFVCWIDATRFELCGRTKLYDSGEIGGDGKGRGSFVDEVTTGSSAPPHSALAVRLTVELHSSLLCSLHHIPQSRSVHGVGSIGGFAAREIPAPRTDPVALHEWLAGLQIKRGRAWVRLQRCLSNRER